MGIRNTQTPAEPVSGIRSLDLGNVIDGGSNRLGWSSFYSSVHGYGVGSREQTFGEAPGTLCPVSAIWCRGGVSHIGKRKGSAEWNG